MRVITLLAALALLAERTTAQSAGGDAAVSYTRAVTVPLNAVLLYDKALDAWNWTFGREPGARLQVTDRNAGVLEGSARLNYRSAQLSLREETMGTVQYRIVLHVRAGECRVTVSELVHTGNRFTPRGGIHLGQLVRGESPPKRVRGTGGGNAKRIYAEVKSAADARIGSLLQAFEARLRASAEP
ncbi:MAG: DUF4468 domain-containing protein [Flavobacteriales bacterium]|nr:DUF4468 domain-containing protein [Flavobacteriales bacterium]